MFAADVRLRPYGSTGNLFMCLDECLNERGELSTTSGSEAIQLDGLGQGRRLVGFVRALSWSRALAPKRMRVGSMRRGLF